MVLYYPMDQAESHSAINILQRQLLKLSLSQILAQFYPLAEKIKDNLSIDCNDKGAYYVEARVKCHLSRFLSQPDIPLIHQFLPCDQVSWWESSAGAHTAMIQLNIFDCGGFAIGVYVSHMIVDGIALRSFLKSWAAAARGFCDAESPSSYIAPSFFPQHISSLPPELSAVGVLRPYFKTCKRVTRRFVFDGTTLATLKAKVVTSTCHSHCPTRVEAVSALIWKCFIAASMSKSGGRRPSLLTHAVNIRRRAIPPLSDQYCMGNFLCLAAAQCKTEEEKTLHHLVGQLREATTKIDGDFVKHLQGDDGFSNYCETLEEMSKAFPKEADYLGVSNWYNFGLYEVDFGWGKPAWASCAGARNLTSVFLNAIVLIETRRGDGIEAWVTLDEQDMSIFQHNRELLTFTSIDPSPLELACPLTTQK